MAIVWREQMSVGNTQVDNDHKYLLILINKVEESIRSDVSEEVFDEVLQQLVMYTHEHFTREEKLMLKIQYPRYAEHKIEHQELVETLQEICIELKSLNKATKEREVIKLVIKNDEAGVDTTGEQAEDYDNRSENTKVEKPPIDEHDKAINHLTQLLRHWILDHVLQTDMKMRKYFKDRVPHTRTS